MNYHEKLREKLDLFPIGLPKTEETMKILRLLFDDEEARIASHVPIPPLFFPAARIAAKTGMDKALVVRKLREMAEKGLIVEMKILIEFRYSLLPAVPGFIEAQFMTGRDIDEKRREAGRLWHEALDGSFGEENYGFPTSGARVIPIGRTVDTTQRIYSFEEMGKVLRASGSLSVTECACRKSAGKCDGPLDVCLMLNASADYLSARGLARRINLRQALKILETTADAGLVHTTTNTMTPAQIVCSCCPCCCATLRGVTALGKPSATVASNFKCMTINDAGCALCGACAEICPMKVVSLDSGRVEIDRERCIGCGVCVHGCPNDALALERVRDNKPFSSPVTLAVKMIEERGKTGRALRSLAEDLLK